MVYLPQGQGNSNPAPAFTGMLLTLGNTSSSTSNTWTVPSGVDTIYVTGVGAGGYVGTDNDGGGGGGGGVINYPLSVTPGHNLTITVGYSTVPEVNTTIEDTTSSTTLLTLEAGIGQNSGVTYTGGNGGSVIVNGTTIASGGTGGPQAPPPEGNGGNGQVVTGISNGISYIAAGGGGGAGQGSNQGYGGNCNTYLGGKDGSVNVGGGGASLFSNGGNGSTTLSSYNYGAGAGGQANSNGGPSFIIIQWINPA
ncbi:MAG: hypothetical protein QXU98_09500 [Candidatus Parvarchaeota archaeon]